MEKPANTKTIKCPFRMTIILLNGVKFPYSIFDIPYSYSNLAINKINHPNPVSSIGANPIN